MGHRHMFNTPQIFDNDSDQGWNQPEPPYMPIARVGSESSSVTHPMDNINIQGGHFPSQWAPAPMAGGYSSTIHNGELPHYQPMGPGPSRGPFLHPSAPGNIQMLQNNYPHNPSSSSIGGQTVPSADGCFYDQAVASGRGPYKRKSPGLPPLCDRGSTSSRYYDVGSSSDPWQEKQNAESYHAHWEYPPSYGVNSLAIGGESTHRNVRSRSTVDLETNLARTQLPNNSLHHSFPSRSSDHSNSVDFWGQNLNAPAREWNRNLIPPTVHGVTSDFSFFGHDPNTVNTLNSQHPNGSLEIGGYNNEITSNRSHVPQNVNCNPNQSVRGVRSGYGQRSVPNFRASSSNFRLGHHVAAPDEGQHLAAESYPSRHPRAFSTSRPHNIDRNGRAFISSDRYRSFTDAASFRDRLTPEGLMVVDHSAYYGSRTLLDQHREMRLDIDNMSYEELLALGERIGTVNTGLEDGLLSKCMTESIYCSSDLSQDEATCVICLEEYKNMDDVGTLKVCGHDFHVGCIRKWLSMKNSCPICKASAMDGKLKEK